MVSGSLASVQSKFLDRKARLAWSGPWAAWGNPSASRPTSAKSDDGSWPNDCHHTGPAIGAVKAQTWSSTLCEQPISAAAAAAAEALERPVSQSSVRSGQRKGLSSASRSWTAPMLINKVVEPTGVSSVESTLEHFRRQKLLTKDFIDHRAELNMNLTVIEAEARGDSGLYDLQLMHGQSARNQAMRKRPPMKPIQENHPILDPRGRHQSAGSRKPSKSGRSSIKEVQELCGLLKNEAVEFRRRMEHNDSNQSRSHRRKATVCNSMQQNTISQQAVLRAIEAKFKDDILYSMPDDEELSKHFGTVIHELMEKFGSLGAAMNSIDKSKKGRLGRHDWEKYVEKAVDHKVDAAHLGRIFAVLDKDHDGFVTYEDVLRFDPVTTMLTREPAPKKKEELIFDEFDQQKTHAQLIRQRKAAVCHNLFFSADHRNVTATLQEIEMRKAEKGGPKKEGLDLLQDFARHYRETAKTPASSALKKFQGDPNASSSDSDDDKSKTEDRGYRVSPGKNASERRITTVGSRRMTQAGRRRTKVV